MKAKGINRVHIIVKDLDKAIALYSEMLNTTFYPVDMAVAFGVRAAISSEAGIEMASPIPGSDKPTALALAKQIEEHGEGLYAVVFDIDEIEQARAKAEEMGIRVLEKREVVDQDVVKRSFYGRYSTFIEYFLNPEDTHGALVVLGKF